MDFIEQRIKTTLYRLECPSDMELGEYEMGFLESTRRGLEIANHSQTCPHCIADLAQIQRYMALPLVDEQIVRAAQEKQIPLWEKMKVVIIDLLSPPKDFMLNPSLQPAMRGSQGDMDTQVFQVESYVIALSSVRKMSSWQRQQIIGDISPVQNDQENFRNWSAYLWREGRLLATTPVDRDSHFIFDDIQLADKPHELILSGPRVEIHLQNLLMA